MGLIVGLNVVSQRNLAISRRGLSLWCCALNTGILTDWTVPVVEIDGLQYSNCGNQAIFEQELEEQLNQDE